VLSVDGGGIRGVIPAVVLAELERLTGRPLSSLFHLMAGTSTGGLLVLGLAKPGPGGGPEFGASDLVSLYETEGRRIFSRSLWHRITALDNLIEEKYPSRGLEDVLRRHLGDTRLSEALTDVLVPAYELERRLPFFFRSSRARTRPDHDFPMRVAAQATAAAPAYFEPVKVPAAGTADGYFALIDGGVYASNPAMCAYVEALTSWPAAQEILVVSLGTGNSTRPIRYDEARGWGLAEWTRPLLGVVFDGVSDTVDYQLVQLSNRSEDGVRRYWRFQSVLPGDHAAIDDASPENVRALRRLADELVAGHRGELEELAARLLAP
jgi:patatin-like phospholipase/acyl hydrolase